MIWIQLDDYCDLQFLLRMWIYFIIRSNLHYVATLNNPWYRVSPFFPFDP